MPFTPATIRDRIPAGIVVDPYATSGFVVACASANGPASPACRRARGAAARDWSSSRLVIAGEYNSWMLRPLSILVLIVLFTSYPSRSEERRVGKECRSR